MGGVIAWPRQHCLYGIMWSWETGNQHTLWSLQHGFLQQLHYVIVFPQFSQVQRGLSRPISDIDISTLGHQKRGNGINTISTTVVQGGVSIGIANVYAAVALEKI